MRFCLLIDTDSYLLQCGKYIELNPVRARIAATAESYRFSSYRYYAYGSHDSIVTSSPAYLALSDDERERRKQYIAFVVDSSIINTRMFQAQLFIGSDAFIRKLEEYYHGHRRFTQPHYIQLVPRQIFLSVGLS